MAFSKEDKLAWESSEVMREFEKMAEDVLQGPPVEAYEPIKEESWEEEEVEPVEVEKCKCAPGGPTLYGEKICAICGNPTEEGDYKEEIRSAYSNLLMTNLEKIANNLINDSKIKAAYRVEQTLEELRDIFKGDVQND